MPRYPITLLIPYPLYITRIINPNMSAINNRIYNDWSGPNIQDRIPLGAS
jgi:hypothetical protein